MQSIIDRLPDNWEAELEYQLLLKQRERFLSSVSVCSPCKADTKKAVYQNIRAARFYTHYILKEMRFVARAPHAYLPVLFSDDTPTERAAALRVGLMVLETSDDLFVCGNRISSGMRGEIEHAAKLGIQITVFHHDLFVDVRKIVTRLNADKSLVRYEHQHVPLSYSAEELFSIGKTLKYA